MTCPTTSFIDKETNILVHNLYLQLYNYTTYISIYIISIHNHSGQSYTFIIKKLRHTLFIHFPSKKYNLYINMIHTINMHINKSESEIEKMLSFEFVWWHRNIFCQLIVALFDLIIIRWISIISIIYSILKLSFYNFTALLLLSIIWQL